VFQLQTPLGHSTLRRHGVPLLGEPPDGSPDGLPPSVLPLEDPPPLEATPESCTLSASLAPASPAATTGDAERGEVQDALPSQSAKRSEGAVPPHARLEAKQAKRRVERIRLIIAGAPIKSHARALRVLSRHSRWGVNGGW
jgi:hypothetical protein